MNADMGIYKICWGNNPNYYYGSSTNLYRRRHYHFSKLRKGTHPSPPVQNTYNKYGIPEFEILVLCETKEELYDNEKFYLKQAEGDVYTLNVNFDPYGKGRLVTKDTREKMSKVRVGKRTLGESRKAKCVINTETLEVHSCMKEVILMGLVKVSGTHFCNMLRGRKTNTTPYIYLPSQKETVEKYHNQQ